MGMLYSQLTEGERNQIYALLQEDVSLRRIAVILGRGSYTIGRELRRNRSQRGYRPKQAQRKAQERRQTPRSSKMTPEVFAYVEEKLHHRGFLVTLVERTSKYTLIGQVKRKKAAAVTAEIVRLLAPYKERVQTITYDNGREFSAHELVNERLDSQSYFAKPYHSWERGLNENTNGLIRQYFPKGMDLREVSRQEIAIVMERLNHRPRKTLAFKTPYDIFVKCESNGFAHVALGSLNRSTSSGGRLNV